MRRTRGSGRLQEAAERIDANEQPAAGSPADGPSRPTPPRTTTVHVRRGTLPDEAAVGQWAQEQEEGLRDAVRHGPVIVR